MKWKKVLIYAAIACCNGTGDVMLKRGMDDLGRIELSHWAHIFNAFINPWVILGIVCLTGFFYSYLTALSWADLTFVLPATAFGYVVTALWSKYFLFEYISPWRWAGVLLITCGVGLVARGPSLTERPDKDGLLNAGLLNDGRLNDALPDNGTAGTKTAPSMKEQHELV